MAVGAVLGLLVPGIASAQSCCGGGTSVAVPTVTSYAPTIAGQEYRLVHETVYDEIPVTAYRIQTETVYEQRRVVRYRPVWETEVRERRYTVQRPVYETSERQEYYTVQRPVWETHMRDCSYNRVRYVTETASREERYITYHPVWETHERTEYYTVRRPVQQTVMRTQYQTCMQPVTTYRTTMVDQGGCVNQLVPKRECHLFKNKLTWQGASCGTNPATGQAVYRPPGLYWVARNPAYELKQTYVPNYVAVQTPVTQLVPQTVATQVPVQVCSYQDERIERKVPYQVCRMVAQENIRQVPYTVSRPVVERVNHQVPVQVCRMETEQHVRRIPVTTCRWVSEERVEQVPVRTCRMAAYEEDIQVPRCVERRIPVNYTVRRPRVVCYRIPLDACGNPISLAAPAQTTPVGSAPPSTSIRTDRPTPAPPRVEEPQPEADPVNSQAAPPDSKVEDSGAASDGGSASTSRLQRVEPPANRRPAPPEDLDFYHQGVDKKE